jgi:hypothetical protein
MAKYRDPSLPFPDVPMGRQSSLLSPAPTQSDECFARKIPSSSPLAFIILAPSKARRYLICASPRAAIQRSFPLWQAARHTSLTRSFRCRLELTASGHTNEQQAISSSLMLPRALLPSTTPASSFPNHRNSFDVHHAQPSSTSSNSVLS